MRNVMLRTRVGVFQHQETVTGWVRLVGPYQIHQVLSYWYQTVTITLELFGQCLPGL